MTGLHLSLNPSPALRRVAWLRPLLGHNIINGLSVGIGLGVLSVLVYLLTDPVIAASASVGMLVTSIGDRTAPSRGKWRQLAPLLWMAAPLTLGVQLAHLLPEYTTVLLGVLVCAGGFIGMLGTALGTARRAGRLRTAAGDRVLDVDAAAAELARGRRARRLVPARRDPVCRLRDRDRLGS